MTGSVTVVMPNLNHGHYLSDAIGALASQSHPPARILFFDDGSGDDSLARAKELARSLPALKVEANVTRKGVVANCNAGLARTGTEYVYFAAADDRVLDGFLETAVRLLDAHPQAALCSLGSVPMGVDGQVSQEKTSTLVGLREGAITPARVRAYARRNAIFMAGNATVYRAARLREIGCMPDVGPYSDSVAIFALALRHGACVSPAPRAAWRRLESSYSARARRDPARSRETIFAAAEWLAGQLRGTRYHGFHRSWRRLALYQVASELILEGREAELRMLLPNEAVWALLARCGPRGRRLANVLALLRFVPQALPRAVQHKLGTAA